MQEPTKVTSDITSDPNAGPQLVIWGTDVVVSQCKDKFRRFISKYVDKNVEADEQFDGMDINEPYYLQRLEEVRWIIVLAEFKCRGGIHVQASTCILAITKNSVSLFSGTTLSNVHFFGEGTEHLYGELYHVKQ